MKKIGIYRISNLIDGKVYIGQSTNLLRRLVRHKCDLKTNIHINKHLQSAWDLHGSNNFHFSILEECPKEQLNERELYWMSHYNSINNKEGYNILLPGEYPRSIKRANRGPKKRDIVCINLIDKDIKHFNSVKSLREYYSWTTKKVGDVLRYWNKGVDANTSKSYKNHAILDLSVFESLGIEEILKRGSIVKRGDSEFERKRK